MFAKLICPTPILSSYPVFTHGLYWWRDDNLQVLSVVYERCVLKVGQLKTGCSKTGGDCIHTIGGQFLKKIFPSSIILARQKWRHHPRWLDI